jgi:VRR-NUC domain
MMARRSPAPPALPLQSEASFQAQVVKLAGRLGWKVYHTHRSEHSAAGFPDLVMVRRPRVLFAELKREDRTVTDDQQAWLDALAGCDVEAYVWRPADWPTIANIISAEWPPR